MMRRLKGFSLIELMVGIAIMAVVMASSVSLGGGWVDESRVTDARSQMRLAYSKARAYALRNSNAVTTASAWMCLNNGVVYVYESTTAKPTGPTTCGDAGSVWHADLAGGTTTKVEMALAANSTAFSCLGFSNRGLPVGATLTGSACTTAQTLYVKRGNTNEATTLH